MANEALETLETLAAEPRPVEDLNPEHVDFMRRSGWIRIRYLERPYKSQKSDLIEWAFITEAARKMLCSLRDPANV